MRDDDRGLFPGEDWGVGGGAWDSTSEKRRDTVSFIKSVVSLPLCTLIVGDVLLYGDIVGCQFLHQDGVLIVTNSSAALGCNAMVRSKSPFVMPAVIPVAND